MASCDKYLEYLSAQLDGELNDAQQAELEAHLENCPSCRELAARLAALQNGLEALEEEPAPAGFVQSVMDKVRTLETKKQPIPLFRRPQIRALAGLAACLAVCVGVWHSGLWTGRSEVPDLPDPDISSAEPVGGIIPRTLPSVEEPDVSADSEGQFSVPTVPDTLGPAISKGPTVQPTPDGDVDLPQPMDLDPGEAMMIEPPEPDHYVFQAPQYLRVTYGMTPAAPAAQIIGSTDRLSDFLAQFPEDDLSAIAANYGTDFFAENRLLVIVLEEPSGSIRHELAGLEQDRVTVRRQVPEVGTDDMAAWLILAEVDSTFQDGAVLEVILT